MDLQRFSARPLIPKPLGLDSQGNPLPSDFLAGPSGYCHQPKSRGPKSTIVSKKSWELHKRVIHQLYWVQDLDLPEVMKEMENKHDFKASRKQYTKQFKEWKFDKNVKDVEKRAIIRKEKERMQQDPPKRSIFRVRGRPVDPQKIERFKRDKNVHQENVMMREADTPSDISWDTPRSQKSTSMDSILRPLSDNDSLFHFGSTSSQVLPENADTSLHFGTTPPLRSPIHNDVQENNAMVLRRHASGVPDNSPPSISPRQSFRVSPSPAQRFARAISPSPQPSVKNMDWWESFVNFSSTSPSPSASTDQILIALRGFAGSVCCYEDREVIESLQLQYSGHVWPPLSSFSSYCDICTAWNAVVRLEDFIRQVHDANCDCFKMDFSLQLSETLPPVLKALDSTSEDFLLDERCNLALLIVEIIMFTLDSEDALQLFRRVLREMELRVGPDHLKTRIVRVKYASWLGRCGDEIAAEHVLEEIIGLHRFGDLKHLCYEEPVMLHKILKWARERERDETSYQIWGVGLSEEEILLEVLKLTHDLLGCHLDGGCPPDDGCYEEDGNDSWFEVFYDNGLINIMGHPDRKHEIIEVKAIEEVDETEERDDVQEMNDTNYVDMAHDGSVHRLKRRRIQSSEQGSELARPRAYDCGTDG